MGAKTWMLVLADASARDALAATPPLDRDATQLLVNALFSGEKLHPDGDGDLSFTSPPDDEIHIGCFPGVSVVAAREFRIDRPSKLPLGFIAGGGGGVATLHAMHSVTDWFAYAQWANGELVRSLSLSPDAGVIEDIGQPLPFEAPFWREQRPLAEGKEESGAYPFPFHPLDLGAEAMKALFGYQLEGPIDESQLDPESILLVRYRRSGARWWRFW